MYICLYTCIHTCIHALYTCTHTLYHVPRAYRPAEGGERACNSHRLFTDGEMLVVTKNNVSGVPYKAVAAPAALDLPDAAIQISL